MKQSFKFRMGLVLVVVLALLVAQMPLAFSAEIAEPEKALEFLRDVAMLDMDKYTVTLAGTTDIPAYLGGSTVGIDGKYILESAESKIDVLFNIRGNTLDYVLLRPLEGLPLFVQPASNTLDVAKSLLERYKTFSQASYLQPLRDMLNEVTELEPMTTTSGNITFTIRRITEEEDYVRLSWMNTVNGIENRYSRVGFTFRYGNFMQFSDSWTRYLVGSADAMSEEEAYSIAKAAVEANSYTIGGQTISGLVVSEMYAPPVAELEMGVRGDALYPYWEFLVPLNQIYPPQVTSYQVMLWADNGELIAVTPISGGPIGDTDPSPETSPPPESSATLPTGVILYASAAVATIVVAVVALALKKRSSKSGEKHD